MSADTAEWSPSDTEASFKKGVPEGIPQHETKPAVEQGAEATPPGAMQLQEDRTVRIHCFNCKRELCDPNYLGCGHLLCALCLPLPDQNGKVVCPRCHYPNNPEEIKSWKGFATASCTVYQREDKLMEEDLLEDPPLTEGPYKNLRYFQIPGFMACETPGPEPKAMVLPEGCSLDDILQELCEISVCTDVIQGFYPCPDRNKVIVDVTSGSKKEAEEKLRKILETKPKSCQDIIEVVEQSDRPTPIVGMGTKIIDQGKDGVEGLVQNNDFQDRLPQPEYRYGSVTCLAETSDNTLCVLTAKHVFSEDPNQESDVKINVVSALSGGLRIIGEHYIGHKGPVRVDTAAQQINVNPPPDRQNLAVDIAAVPLLKDIRKQLDSNLIYDLKPYFDGDSSSLQEVRVTKQGARTGNTSGKIIIPHYFNTAGGRVAGGYIVIAANEGADFALMGDSGSLVWTIAGTPLGIVVDRNPCFSFHKREFPAVFAVRLDNCIKALSMIWGKTVVKCKAYNAPLPVDQPGDILQLPQLEEMDQG